MANDNTEIGDIVKKCKYLLLDIEGTTTSISFVKDKLFPYAEEKVKQFLDSQWESQDVKEAINDLRKLALEDKEKSVDGVVAIPGEDASKEDQIEGLVGNVKWQMSSDRKTGALKQLQGLIWKQGYDNGDIKGHVYDDVSAALEQWRAVDGQKVYIYSSGSVQAQKLLFGQSTAGDLLKLIDGHFDTAVGAKQEATSYTAIAEKIGCKADEILFLTDIVKEAEAAREAGVRAALVSREGNTPLPEDAIAAFPVLHSLTQLTVSNKRKPDTQEEVPAKVPKTDTCEDVKTSECEEPKTTAKVTDEPEKMEVEEAGANVETKSNGENIVKEDASVPSKTITEDSSSAESMAKKPKPVETITDETMEVESVPEKPAVAEVIADKPVVAEVTEEVVTVKKTVEDKDETKEMAEIPANTDVAGEKIRGDGPMTDEPLTKDTKTEKSDIETSKDVKTSEKPVPEEPKMMETIVEEITDSNEAASIPSINAEPIVTVESTDIKEIEKIDVASTVTPKEAKEIENRKENEPLPEETPPAIVMEIEEITDEKESLGEVAEIIEDLEPVVEEPLASEEMEELQNVGEVLDKECDEILSKVQDVTNLDNIPLKPLLNSIPEEMENENPDTSDIVERILDSELELEMKQCGDIDLNTVAEITDEENSDTKKDVTKESVKEHSPTEQNSIEGQTTENQIKANKVTEEKFNESSPAEKQAEEVKEDEIKISETESKEKPVEQSSGEPQEEPKKNEPEKDSKAEEPQINGKATNGESQTEVKEVNGDASKDDLSSRLSVENGKEVNGSNGDANNAEKGQGDNKVEAEVSDIKVKSVATDERTDPIEQPTEA